jgi:hypothetical protein
MWGHFFGIGLVEPIDDFSEHNPASHPELMDVLAKEFVAHKYDLKFLIRAITLSRAYQLTSRQTDSRQADPRAFARMSIKGLAPEQLYDTLLQATGGFEPFTIQNPFVFAQTTPKGTISELFSDVGTTPTDRVTTILQSLALMNGEFVDEATQVERGALLGAVCDFPGFETGDKVEILFLAALTRLPTDDERRNLTEYVDRGGPQGDPQKALADVFWAILNSSEFLYNH